MAQPTGRHEPAAAATAQPLYRQIREALRSGILEGSYAPLAKLPSESQLMARFAASRLTVRQALRDLQREGLLFAVPGKGSFVTLPKAVQEISRLQGLAEAMGPQGYQTCSRVLSLGPVPAAPRVAQALQLEAGATVIELQRVRYLNRAPVSLDVSYFAESVGRRLAQADLVARDVFAILENDLGLPLEAAELAIDAALADAELARQLGVALGSAVLRIERLTYTRSARPIDFEYLYCAGSAYRYRLRVERGGPDAARTPS